MISMGCTPISLKALANLAVDGGSFCESFGSCATGVGAIGVAPHVGVVGAAGLGGPSAAGGGGPTETPAGKLAGPVADEGAVPVA